MKSTGACLALALGVAIAGFPGGEAQPWGATGHRLIGEAAMRALPSDLPSFLRTRQAALDVGELSREPDRWRNAGRIHDADRDPAHYVDVDGDGRVLGGPALDTLPPTRSAYDAALRAAGADPSDAGYLPYAIADAWQQLAKDMAYWRALSAASKRERNTVRRAWLKRDLARRESLILRDLGVLSHYVGDGAMPLHVTIHSNGWKGANPDGYAVDKVHGRLEGAFVRSRVGPAAVRQAMPAPARCDCPVETRTARYLGASLAQVEPLYALDKDGGFSAGDARGPAFMAARLGAGAAEVRDLVVEAWRVSSYMQVGWPPVAVREVESGHADAYGSLYGND